MPMYLPRTALTYARTIVEKNSKTEIKILRLWMHLSIYFLQCVSWHLFTGKPTVGKGVSCPVPRKKKKGGGVRIRSRYIHWVRGFFPRPSQLCQQPCFFSWNIYCASEFMFLLPLKILHCFAPRVLWQGLPSDIIINLSKSECGKNEAEGRETNGNEWKDDFCYQ